MNTRTLKFLRAALMITFAMIVIIAYLPIALEFGMLGLSTKAAWLYLMFVGILSLIIANASGVLGAWEDVITRRTARALMLAPVIIGIGAALPAHYLGLSDDVIVLFVGAMVEIGALVFVAFSTHEKQLTRE